MHDRRVLPGHGHHVHAELAQAPQGRRPRGWPATRPAWRLTSSGAQSSRPATPIRQPQAHAAPSGALGPAHLRRARPACRHPGGARRERFERRLAAAARSGSWDRPKTRMGQRLRGKTIAQPATAPRSRRGVSSPGRFARIKARPRDEFRRGSGPSDPATGRSAFRSVLRRCGKAPRTSRRRRPVARRPPAAAGTAGARPPT